jgi:amino acid transporter
MAQNGPSPGLAREAIGLREVLFQSITHMAPAAAVAFSIIVGANFAAGALPLSVLLALVGCLLVAVSIGQLARRLPSAGGFYTYAARGLHPAVGFLVGWGYAFVEPLVAPLLFLIFGNVVASTLNQEFGWSYDTWWVVAAVAAALVVLVLGWFGVRLSTGAGTLLGLFEILVFAALAVTLIVKAGDANTLSVFGTGQATVEGFEGFSGVVAGSVYTILAFIGFEAAAPLAEEAKDPRRTIRLAVIYSCLGIGLFYVLTTYAATVSFGPDKFAEFANANASANAATRTWFAMGRIRLLPRPLEHVNPRWRSPDVAVVVQFLVGVGVSLWLGLQYDPLTAFAIVGTIVTAVIIAIYMVVNLACLVFYLREGRAEFNPVLHGLVPILGILAFLPAFLTAVGIEAFDFVSALPYPISLVGPVVGIWYAIGLVYLVVLMRRRPERLRETGRVFVEEPAGEAVLPS